MFRASVHVSSSAATVLFFDVDLQQPPCVAELWASAAPPDQSWSIAGPRSTRPSTARTPPSSPATGPPSATSAVGPPTSTGRPDHRHVPPSPPEPPDNRPPASGHLRTTARPPDRRGRPSLSGAGGRSSICTVVVYSFNFIFVNALN